MPTRGAIGTIIRWTLCRHASIRPRLLCESKLVDQSLPYQAKAIVPVRDFVGTRLRKCIALLQPSDLTSI